MVKREIEMVWGCLMNPSLVIYAAIMGGIVLLSILEYKLGAKKRREIKQWKYIQSMNFGPDGCTTP